LTSSRGKLNVFAMRRLLLDEAHRLLAGEVEAVGEAGEGELAATEGLDREGTVARRVEGRGGALAMLEERGEPPGILGLGFDLLGAAGVEVRVLEPPDQCLDRGVELSGDVEERLVGDRVVPDPCPQRGLDALGRKEQGLAGPGAQVQLVSERRNAGGGLSRQKPHPPAPPSQRP